MIYLTDILQLVKIFQVLRNSNRGDSVKIHTNFTMKNKVLQALKINSSGSKVKKERIILLYNRRMLYTYVHIHIYIYILSTTLCKLYCQLYYLFSISRNKIYTDIFKNHPKIKRNSTFITYIRSDQVENCFAKHL
jgi:hypothetical protein